MSITSFAHDERNILYNEVIHFYSFNYVFIDFLSILSWAFLPILLSFHPLPVRICLFQVIDSGHPHLWSGAHLRHGGGDGPSTGKGAAAP